MLIDAGAVVVGLSVLVWSADRLVEAAASLARRLGVSTLITGIVVVGFGTSMPEFGVAISAALEGSPGLSTGDAIGSNIANIGLILGFTAMLSPVPVQDRLFRSEFPLLLAATAILALCLLDLRLGTADGIVLLVSLALALAYLIWDHRRSPAHFGPPRAESTEPAKREVAGEVTSLPGLSGRLLVGLALLVGSSLLLVRGAANIATQLGVSDHVVGLTIVAVGTSLPELAASIASLRRAVPGVAIGNIVGSNLFNSLAVIGLLSVMADFEIDPVVPGRDLGLVTGMTLAMILAARFPATSPRRIARSGGLLLFGAFVIYQLSLYHAIVAGQQ